MRQKTIITAALPVFAVFLALSGCGIPQLPYLAPPESETLRVELSTVRFLHNAQANENANFHGYEIYYKFYSFDASPEDGPFASDRAQVQSATAGPTFLPSGFYRITEADPAQSSLPLIPVDTADSIEITVSFPESLVGPYAIAATWEDAGGPQVVPIVRHPTSGGGIQSKTFEPGDIALDPADPDLASELEASGNTLHMGIVVLAYGVNYDDNFAPIYSVPVMAIDPLLIIVQ